MRTVAVTILKAFVSLVAGPTIGLAVAFVLTMIPHYLSGEASDPSSGQPWIMLGGLLFAPLGVMIGATIGLAQAVNIVWDAIAESKKAKHDAAAES